MDAVAKRVAIVGATGVVGRAMLETLEKQRFPVRELTLYASEASAGQTLLYGGRELAVQALRKDAVPVVDVALFSAGAGVSREYAPRFVAQGAVVIDNSSAWRMDPSVPLVVPEVNPESVRMHRGIISNPNCVAIPMSLPLAALQRVSLLTQVIASTYQAVSGAGQRGLDEWTRQEADPTLLAQVFPHRIDRNLFPQVGPFLADGSTEEEQKIQQETAKILNHPVPMQVTCVRVPVARGHSVSVSVQTQEPLQYDTVIQAFRDFKGLVCAEEAAAYHTPLAVEGSFLSYVSRVRVNTLGVHFWCVADNLLKGAASNAVQIAELLL